MEVMRVEGDEHEVTTSGVQVGVSGSAWSRVHRPAHESGRGGVWFYWCFESVIGRLGSSQQPIGVTGVEVEWP